MTDVFNALELTYFTARPGRPPIVQTKPAKMLDDGNSMAEAVELGSARAVAAQNNGSDHSGNGRGDRIRTYDLRYPKPSRYQAALRPDGC